MTNMYHRYDSYIFIHNNECMLPLPSFTYSMTYDYGSAPEPSGPSCEVWDNPVETRVFITLVQ